jgi:hypothetical protein
MQAMRFATFVLSHAAIGLASLPAFAQTTTVNYTMSIAGLPIGSATMAMTPNGASTAVAISGSAGGPLQIGRMNATAVIGQGRVTAQSNAGSGKDASSASLSSQGSAGASSFTYAGVNGRGPAKLTMAMAGGRVTALEQQIPDNPKAVRVPVTDAHKAGVTDPLMALAQVVKPGGMLRPEGVCGKSHQVFTGVARFSLAGTAPQESAAVKGMPDGYRAVACRVTMTPIAGHRIDKGNAAQVRTAAVTFAVSGEKAVLWSLSVPVAIGSFALTAKELN